MASARNERFLDMSDETAEPGPTASELLAEASALATQAATAARDRSGYASEAWERPQRHAFAVLTFGIASAVVAHRLRDAQHVPDVAVDALRAAVRLPFREAVATVDAIVAALTAKAPDPAVQGLLRCGWAAGDAWLRGDSPEFDDRVVQATASDAFASDRPLF